MRCFNLRNTPKEYYTYRIVDANYQSNIKIKALDYLSQSQQQANPIMAVSCNNVHTRDQIFNDKALIGEKEYDLTVESMSDSSYLLQCNSEKYSINNTNITADNSAMDVSVLLGPVLILNLAINNIFCLHSSAFLINDKVFILMGDSGTGKSTIARFINELSQCERVVDDIFPLKIRDNQLLLYPNFPQLKLSSDQQYKGVGIVKDTILLFAEKSDEPTQLKPIDDFQSMKKIISHTVATKLFANDELKNHLAFCYKVSSLTKSYHVKYQHAEGSLEKLYQLLNEHC